MTPLEAGCPWSALSNFWLPNVKWCEAQLCSWVVEPANTWSNLAYVFIGLALLWLGRRSANRLQTTFGAAELVVGVFSFTFHMSYSGILQILDFAAMFVFVGLTLSLNLVRLGWLSPARRTRVYVIAVIALTLMTFGLRFTSFPIQAVTPVLILATVVTEVWLAASRARRHATRYGWFFASLVLLLGATAFSIADATRAMCDPHDHIVQGHAIWHLLSALSLACAWRFYDQFRDTLTARYRGAAPA